jgi:hypothetical protein
LRESESGRASRREREREGEGLALPVFSHPFVVRLLVLLSCPPPPLRGALDTPFYRHKEMPSCIMGV